MLKLRLIFAIFSTEVVARPKYAKNTALCITSCVSIQYMIQEFSIVQKRNKNARFLPEKEPDLGSERGPFVF